MVIGDVFVMTNRLPEKLTALRKHFGYSQGDLAEMLQVPVTEYMNWENGNTICRIDQLRDLAKMFRVPIEDLADNTRTVTLPRLDEDDDSVQIAFGAMRTAAGGDTIVAQTLSNIDVADNLMVSSGSEEEPVLPEEEYEEDLQKTRIMRPDDIQETMVNEIIDDDDEEEEEPEPVRPPVRKKPQPQRPAQKSSFKLPFDLSKIDRKVYLIGGGVLAALVILITVINLFRGRGSGTVVELGSTNRLALGGTFSMYLPSEGNLVTAGQNIPDLDSEELVQVSAGPSWAMGLKKDGTVVCSGAGNACKVEDWDDIVMIAAGENHSVGLKSDGTVVCNGSSGACSVDDWKDVKAVYAGNEITLGITDTGSVLASGSFNSIETIRNLTSVKAAAIGSNQIVITGIDGSVNCYAINSSTTSDTSSWNGMDYAVTGGSFAAGISGGRVKAASTDDELVKTVEEWSGIQYIAARNNTLIAVNSNGKVIGAGDNSMGVYGDNDAQPTETSETDGDSERLKQVTNVKFSVTSANLQITWDKVTDADYYTVSINTTPATSLKTEKPTASISTDKLKSGTTYVVQITSCAKDETKHKNSETFFINYQYEANLTKLAAPSGITCTQSGTSMKISWNAVANADHYEVTVEDITQNVSGTSVTLDLNGWSNKDFTVYVTAYPKTEDTRYTFSDTGTGTGRYEVEKRPLDGTPAINQPTLNADNSITVTWNSVPGAGSYNVSVGEHSATVNTTSFTTPVLTAGTYQISVVAVPSDTSRYTETSAGYTYTLNITPQPEPVQPDPQPQPEDTQPENPGEGGEGGDGQPTG